MKNLKKSRFSKVLMSLVLVVVLSVGFVVTAHAATVYYPTDGIASGNCTNVIKSSVAEYSLTGGKYKVNYSLIAGETMQLRFYHNSNLTGLYDAATITNNPNGASTYITLSKSSGTAKYYAVVCAKDDEASSFTYAYTLSK